MFDFVRQHTRLALGFMLLLIIPSFVFFGIQGYSRFTDGANATLAKVDGHTITQAEFDAALKRVLDGMRRQQPTADPAQLDTPQLRRDTLESLVRERVMLAAANQLHLFPTAARMQRLFDSDPQLAPLRGPDGKISREFLAMQGMSVEMFDARLRQDFGVRQVMNGVLQTVPAAATPASAALNAYLQQRTVQLLRFDPNAYREKITPTDAELEAFYKAHESDFKSPEQATIEYAVLDLAALGQGITVSDDELKKAYADAGARYTVPDERRASHILIKADKDRPAAERAKAKAKAEALLAEVKKNPGSFADVARKNSEDSSAAQGGDLDFFGRGAMVKPFEDAAFSMQPGQISDVVETDYGYHIIMVTGKRGGESKPFDSVRAELEAELRKTKAQSRWAEAAEQFTNTVYEQSDSLDPVVSKLKLEKKTATVTRTPAPNVQGPLANAKFLDAVFGNESLRNKRNTDAVEVGPNQLISAHVVTHQPSRVQPLAEVKNLVRERVVAEQAAALARKEGEAKLAALRAAGATEALPIVLTLSRAQGQTVPKPILDAALRADPAKLPALEGIDLGAQGYIVMRVMQVLPRETPPGGDDALRGQYAQAWGAAEAEAYLTALKKRFKAETKPAAEATIAAAAASAAQR